MPIVNQEPSLVDMSRDTEIKMRRLEALQLSGVGSGFITFYGNSITQTVSVGGRATSTAPSGWLMCNGNGLDKRIYPALFKAIGYAHGGSGNTFNLPNIGYSAVIPCVIKL
jgi:hypothetical protein